MGFLDDLVDVFFPPGQEGGTIPIFPDVTGQSPLICSLIPDFPGCPGMGTGTDPIPHSPGLPDGPGAGPLLPPPGQSPAPGVATNKVRSGVYIGGACSGLWHTTPIRAKFDPHTGNFIKNVGGNRVTNPISLVQDDSGALEFFAPVVPTGWRFKHRKRTRTHTHKVTHRHRRRHPHRKRLGGHTHQHRHTGRGHHHGYTAAQRRAGFAGKAAMGR